MATVEQPTKTSSDGAPPRDEIVVENPATGAEMGRIPNLDADAIADMVGRAREAQREWYARGFKARGQVMLAFRSWFVDNRERIVSTIVDESGKAREDALYNECAYTLDSLGFWAKKAEKYLRDERIRAHSPLLFGKKLLLRYRPLGVVGVIGPWNYPLTNNFGDAIPALMAGNAVVLKPSSVTPFTSLLMAEGLEACGMPKDVFQVLTGSGGAGSALVDKVDMVMFTGSTEVGRKVGAQAGERLIPVALELGGKDPMIVLDDADLERAANAAITYSFGNGGQTCIAVERVYAHEQIHDEFVSKVVEKTRKLRQGAPTDWGAIDVGAVTFPDQLDVLKKHVADAREKGARIHVGGETAPGPGRFFEPTVLTDVDHSMEIMTEETFGPVLPIMKVRDADEAVRLANDSPYGLDSSVWTKDIAKGERVARQVEAGATCVNDALVNYLALEVPFGGAKDSGLGARHGTYGIRKYCGTQNLLVTRFGLKREPNFLPYRKGVSKVMERGMVMLYGGRQGGGALSRLISRGRGRP